jgi:alkanesulfonate monooxygenase SsuD/methylene tetrahydromethanopterin reductase-like flavin-dependent oxidoreductase (luciferase family)
MAGRNGYNIMTVAHVRPPEEVRPGVDAWRAGLREGGHDPDDHHCLIHMRGFVGDDNRRAQEVAEAALGQYNRISREGLGRAPREGENDWETQAATGRNIYGDPVRCIELMHRTRHYFDFDVFGMQFAFGGLPHAEVVRSMRRFAEEVMPAFA